MTMAPCCHVVASNPDTTTLGFAGAGAWILKAFGRKHLEDHRVERQEDCLADCLAERLVNCLMQRLMESLVNHGVDYSRRRTPRRSPSREGEYLVVFQCFGVPLRNRPCRGSSA